MARLLAVLVTYSSFVLGSSRSWDGENLSYPGCGIIPSIYSSINCGNCQPASYPWMAFLFYSSKANGESSFCGATLISDIQMVTAAHCVSGKTTDEVAVVIGNPNVTYELNKWNFKYIYKIEIYPFYRENIGDNELRQNPDIAILTLEEPLLLGSKINPICLPSIGDTFKTYAGVTATVAGWGKTETGQTSTDQLLKAEVPVLSNNECKAFYNWLKRCFDAQQVNVQ